LSNDDAKLGDVAVSIVVPAPTATAQMDDIFDMIIDQFAGGTPSDEKIDSLLTRLLDTLAGDLEQPEKLAEAIEPTAPKIAERVRSLTNPEAVTAYINLLIAVINLILLLSNTFHHPPPAGGTQQIIFNITNNTSIINPPAAPPTPPPGH
jgi:hypothetical protein